MDKIFDVKIQLIKEKSALYSKSIIQCPEDAAMIISQYMEGTDRETFIALLLNTKHRVIAINTISIGVLDRSMVHPREVFKAAILGNAKSIIIAHNHPSGDVAPSNEDISITKKLMKVGKLLEIPVQDHIIVDSMGLKHMSLREYGVKA